MWRVACGATFYLDHLVFKYEWSLFVAVTLKANGRLVRARAQLERNSRTVGIVAVVAGDKSFVYAMPVRLHKISLDLQVALVTQLRRFRLEEIL